MKGHSIAMQLHLVPESRKQGSSVHVSIDSGVLYTYVCIHVSLDIIVVSRPLAKDVANTSLLLHARQTVRTYVQLA